MRSIQRNYGLGVIAAVVASTTVIALCSPAAATLGAAVALTLGIAAVLAVVGVTILSGRAEARNNIGRHRLTDPAIGAMAPFRREEIDEEAGLRLLQVAHVFGQLRLMMSMTAVNAALVTAVLLPAAERWWLLGWLVLVAGFSGLGWWAGRERPDRGPRKSASKRTLRRIVLHSGIRGGLWGLCFALFFGCVGTTGQHVLLTVAMGMTAGGIVALAPIPAAAIAYGAGAIAPTIVRLSTMGGLDYVLLAALGIMFTGTLTMIGAQMYRSFAGGYVAQREHEEQSATISMLLNEFEQSAADWLWETDGDGRIVHASPRMLEAFGSVAADNGATFAQLLRRLSPTVSDGIDAVMAARSPFRDCVFATADLQGEKRWIALTGSPKPEGGYRGVGRDITSETQARLDAAAALVRAEQAEQRLTDGIASLGAAFVLTDAEDRIVLANRRLHELLPAAALLGPHARFEQIAFAQATLWTPSAADSPCAWRDALIASRKGEVESVDIELPNGQWLRTESRATAEGGLVTVLTSISDIKEKEAALAQSAERLAESNRELQQFATIASHDLQEPLRKIEAFGGRLEAKMVGVLDDDGKFYLDRMLASSRRMRRLISDLLAYSRVTRKVRTASRVDLDRLLSDVVDDLSVAIADKRAKLDIGPLGHVLGEPTQLRQLFQNLLSNALKFSRAEEAPRIRVQRQPDAGELARILVADNGIGFDMKHHDKIFEIFQRLHGVETYEGTGIGLATCRRIVEHFGGSLRAESAPGEGAVFHIELPLASAGDDPQTRIQAAA